MVLGDGVNRDAKSSAIAEAYDALSQEAFAVWIRLMVATPTQLASGRGNLAKLLGYSEGRSNAVLRELRHKGYISLLRGGQTGTPTQLRIEVRALIAGPNSFIRLSSIVTSRHLINDETVNLANVKHPLSATHKSGSGGKGVGSSGVQLGQSKKGGEKCVSLPKLPNQANSVDNLNLQLAEKVARRIERPRFKEVSAGIKPPSANVANTYAGEHDNVIRLEDYVPTDVAGSISAQSTETDPRTSLLVTSSSKKSSSKKIDLEKMIGTREKRKKEDLEKRQKKTEENKKAREKGPDWSKVKGREHIKLDKRGLPAITFSPSDELREQFIKAFDAKYDPNRNFYLNKMGTEVLRIYTTYRREIHRAYVIDAREKKYACSLAELCIRNCVTPQLVIQYWHEHIGEFTDMKFPPLFFLASAANVSRVACVDFEKKAVKPKKPADAPVERHSFSDLGQLDKRLRAGLEEAGVDTKGYNDRHMLSVQKTAVAIAKGYTMFVSPVMKEMVDWAAENLYAYLKGGA